MGDSGAPSGGVGAELVIERYEDSNVDFAELTNLLHRAYARLVESGFDYVAATQSTEVTRTRVEAGVTLIARENDRLVGMISYYSGTPRTRPYPEWYDREDVGFFGQFAVLPERRGQGIGDCLLATVASIARGEGKTELACDTARDVRSLVRYYEERGFRRVGVHRWPQAGYESVVLSKRLV